MEEIEEGNILGSRYTSKTDKEIKDLAVRLYRGEIFTSLQINQHDQNLTPQIFLPLVFMTDIDLRQLTLDGAHMLYSEMKDAGPMAINGYPNFTSFAYLNKEDTGRFVNKYNEILDMMSNV